MTDEQKARLDERERAGRLAEDKARGWLAVAEWAAARGDSVTALKAVEFFQELAKLAEDIRGIYSTVNARYQQSPELRAIIEAGYEQKQAAG